MKNAEQLCKLLDIELSADERHDCRYLERRGYRFCVDFGYDNAADLVDTHNFFERQQKTTFLRRDQV